MSRRKTQAELDEELEAEVEREGARIQRQQSCHHSDCYPSRWNWATGRPEEMTCNECGDINYLET